jgi:DNA-binding response OmpR family regulator
MRPRGALSLATRKTVLLVDREPIVLDLLASALSRGGFHTLAADSYTDARLLFDAHSPKLCLALIDISPEMSGLEFVQSLPNLTPRIPILFTTGLGDLSVEERLGPDWPVLYKPFNVRQLEAAMSNVLERTWRPISRAQS